MGMAIRDMYDYYYFSFNNVLILHLLDVLKQQSHALDMSCMAYSPDGQYIATGGDDGKVKVWNASNGFCFVTFSEHEASITGIVFSQKNAIFTSSSDGTVR